MAMSYTEVTTNLPAWVEDESTEFAALIGTIMERAQDRCYNAVPELQQMITSASALLVAGSATVPRPADALFFRSFEITSSESKVILERRDRTVLVEMYPSTTAQGTPRYYAEDGPSLLRLAPTPNSAYAYTVYYGRKLSYLSASNETNWLTDYAPDLLYYAVLVEAYILKDYPDSVRLHLGAFGRSVNDIRKRHGLNERDDYRALYAPVSTDNQGDSPVPVTARMKMMQQPQQEG